MPVHKVEALVQSCIDYRFREPMNDFIKHTLGLRMVDLRMDAGGCKTIAEPGPIRQWCFENLKIAFEKHAVNRVVLINHQDCGAYGGSTAFQSPEWEIATHESHLIRAAESIRIAYPGKQVQAYLALISSNEQISFRQVPC